MCIYCNLPDGACQKADRFLDEFGRASQAMKRAADAMLDVARASCSTSTKRRYDQAHKMMVRLRRDWNRIEQEREQELEQELEDPRPQESPAA